MLQGKTHHFKVYVQLVLMIIVVNWSIELLSMLTEKSAQSCSWSLAGSAYCTYTRMSAGAANALETLWVWSVNVLEELFLNTNHNTVFVQWGHWCTNWINCAPVSPLILHTEESFDWTYTWKGVNCPFILKILWGQNSLVGTAQLYKGLCTFSYCHGWEWQNKSYFLFFHLQEQLKVPWIHCI